MCPCGAEQEAGGRFGVGGPELAGAEDDQGRVEREQRRGNRARRRSRGSGWTSPTSTLPSSPAVTAPHRRAQARDCGDLTDQKLVRVTAPAQRPKANAHLTLTHDYSVPEKT